MEPITLRDLRTYLKERSYEELSKDIIDLFKKLDAVKDYYQARLHGGYDEALLEKYKDRVRDEFFPARGFGEGRIAIARKAISDYRKVSSSPEGLADLMLFYVEMGVRFTNEYGDIDEPFYNSMDSMYENVCKLIVKHHLQDLFEPRCHKIVRDTAGIGWGFHDSVTDIYEKYFSEYL